MGAFIMRSLGNTKHRQVSCVPIHERFSCGEGVYDAAGDDVGEIIVGSVCTSRNIIFYDTPSKEPFFSIL